MCTQTCRAHNFVTQHGLYRLMHYIYTICTLIYGSIKYKDARGAALHRGSCKKYFRVNGPLVTVLEDSLP
jgi:hypothetical protein